MAFVVSLRSALLAAAILQAVFIGLSRPESTTEEEDVNTEFCNETCTTNRHCSNSSCFCVFVNNSNFGQCWTWSWDGEYNETLLEAATPRQISNQ
uniref:Putative evasin n=1 Tax=Rhipicephalus microplus TaxID=6941 RepID=A0A6G5A2J8_RHIMP